VVHGLTPKKVLLEVTRAVHEKEYLIRELINQGGASFGVKGIARNKKTREILSEPYVRHEGKSVSDLADQIIEALKNKAAKKYAPGTVLIIESVPNGIVLEEEWKVAIKRVKDANVRHDFGEAFIFCGYLNHSATLWGKEALRSVSLCPPASYVRTAIL
jgi:hypothetical protein